jgi:hypothetical protein
MAVVTANNRNTQNSSQMYSFLIMSITDGLLGKIILQKEQYTTATGFQDMMMNVHVAYMECKDTDFVRHAKDEYRKWEQGASMTLKEYMASALTKYKTLKMKGMWEGRSPEQEQIIMLTAAFSLLRATKICTDKTGDNKKDMASIGKNPRRNNGDFAYGRMWPQRRVNQRKRQ